ncbi:hypothetical protein CDAR_597131 [Caerostris darwini]|uniref:Uncharacterized protein n=1 Tax=Caerostris darwini TaxID=1538125 RepID=A0AAV4U2E7_9ARAC|nr:hypothetical protein CDAR_597131 [Caerostris darwini]
MFLNPEIQPTGHLQKLETDVNINCGGTKPSQENYGQPFQVKPCSTCHPTLNALDPFQDDEGWSGVFFTESLTEIISKPSDRCLSGVVFGRNKHVRCPTSSNSRRRHEKAFC